MPLMIGATPTTSSVLPECSGVPWVDVESGQSVGVVSREMLFEGMRAEMRELWANEDIEGVHQVFRKGIQ